jgi:hypothetical protein
VTFDTQARDEIRKDSQDRRRGHRERAAKALTKAGAVFTVHNDGAHLRVTTPAGVIDYWPGTGKVRDPRGYMFRIGLRGVLAMVKP